MNKMRIYEVAKQLNLEPKAVVSLCQSLGMSQVRNHMSSVEVDAVERLKAHLEKKTVQQDAFERIRPTVIKRRAAVKSDKEEVAVAQHPPKASVDAVPNSVKPEGVSGLVQQQPAVILTAPSPVREDVKETHKADKVGEPAKLLEVQQSEQPLSEQEAAPSSEKKEYESNLTALRVKSTKEEERAGEGRQETTRVQEKSTEGFDQTQQLSSKETDVTKNRADLPLPLSTPKKGIEYWAGRPGVPMPPPPTSSSSGGFSNGERMSPRRVQYETRAAGTGSAVRRDVRTGSPVRGGAGLRTGSTMRRGSAVPSRKTSVISTKEMSEHKKVIRIEGNITLQGMASKLSLKSTELLMKLLSMGMTGIHINTTLDADIAKLLASEFGWEVEDVAETEEQSLAVARGEMREKGIKEQSEELVHRAPVVTIMGHVDHGKTSLLDRIRKSNVAAGEAGGITQHVGAYKVNTHHGAVVLLDTPGHEAFTQMRARGAQVTDIVVLVVAADDGVMPQTKEAISHAQAAKVPILVAVNKVDKAGADPERIKRQLMEVGLQAEEWGGDTIFVNVSAHTGQGVEQLLDMLALQAEVLELKANPKEAASATVLEALLDRGRGPVARVLVQQGTLKVGDFVLAGPGFGKIRAMTNEQGKYVVEAGPSTPVELLGLSDLPSAGDLLYTVKDSKKAQEIAESRKGKKSLGLIPSTAKVSLEEISKRIADADQKELRVIVKGDVQGSVEAIADALSKLSSEKVRLSVVYAGVGAITEGDVNLAVATKAIIVGFHVRPAGKASSLAEENRIEIRLYSIIYNVIDELRAAMEGLLPPTLVEQEIGKAEVRQCFTIKNEVVAGCYVLEGEIKRSAKVRVVRGSEMLWDGKISALKRFKDDVKSVQGGFECGISFEGFNGIQEKDIVACYEIQEVKQKL